MRGRPAVLIVGAGPVGLGLAIELGSSGIPCLLVEQHENVGNNPRAKLTNVRSMELLRRWGIAGRLRAASPMPRDYPSDIVFATRLAGHTLARFRNAFYCAADGSDWYSEPAQWVPQYTVEEVLRQRVRELPCVDARFGTRLVGLEQKNDRVVAALEGGERVECAYAVGCDGARSTVRELLGIPMEGTGALGTHFGVLFRSPELAALHDKGRAVQYWLVNREVPTVMGPMDAQGLWFFGVTRFQSTEGVDAGQLVRTATGLDLRVQVTWLDPWKAHRLIASRYRAGRVFLAGDACHLHPPFGGYGMNMGLGDAVDLGWKLAAVLQGWGGPGLLDSYEAERRSVHERVIAESVENHAVLANELANDDLERDDAAGHRARVAVGALIRKVKLREFRTLGVVIGYRYKDSPIVVHDGSDAPPDTVTDYVPSAHPGRLAPHFWLDDGRSLYDCIGAGFTLLADAAAAPEDYAALERAAREGGVPLRAVRVEGSRSLRELYEAPLCLVRTDHHVAWRGERLPDDVNALLDRVRGGKP